MDLPFKNYELIMGMVLIVAIIFMIIAFVKISIEHEEERDEHRE